LIVDYVAWMHPSGTELENVTVAMHELGHNVELAHNELDGDGDQIPGTPESDFRSLMNFAPAPIAAFTPMDSFAIAYLYPYTTMSYLSTTNLIGIGAVRLLQSVSTFQEQVATSTVPYRLAALNIYGQLIVKVGSQSGEWDNVMSGVKQYQINGTRIAVLLNDNRLLIKDVETGARWIQDVAVNVKKFQLEGTRIAVLLTDGTLYVKDVSISAAWDAPMHGGVRDFVLEGDRIAIIVDSDGEFKIKKGAKTNGWYLDRSRLGITSMSLEGNRILVKNATGLWGKDDPTKPFLATPIQVGNIQSFKMSGNRIGVLVDSYLYVKDGISAIWGNPIEGNISNFRLDGNRIEIIKNREVKSKLGISGIWYLQGRNANGLNSIP
jgi:hypothetical protein